MFRYIVYIIINLYNNEFFMRPASNSIPIVVTVVTVGPVLSHHVALTKNMHWNSFCIWGRVFSILRRSPRVALCSSRSTRRIIRRIRRRRLLQPSSRRRNRGGVGLRRIQGLDRPKPFFPLLNPSRSIISSEHQLNYYLSYLYEILPGNTQRYTERCTQC